MSKHHHRPESDKTRETPLSTRPPKKRRWHVDLRRDETCRCGATRIVTVRKSIPTYGNWVEPRSSLGTTYMDTSEPNRATPSEAP